jgi:PhnB protein
MSDVKAIPEGLHTVTPSMTIDGCAEALEFYKKAFGAEETMRAPDPSGKKIWHAEFRIGNSRVFCNDAVPDRGGGANVSRLWIYTAEVDAAWKRATDAGMKVKMPIADMFWGDRMGTVVDKWGNEWTLAKHIKDLTPAEMKKAQDEFVASMKK